MGKRYKAGNHGKRKPKKGQSYMEREIRINQLIRQFKRILNNNPFKISNYKKADRIRAQIKHLLGCAKPRTTHQVKKTKIRILQTIIRFQRIICNLEKTNLPTIHEGKIQLSTTFNPHLIRIL